MVETELPVTPSPDVSETMTSSPIDIEEIREPSDQTGPFEKQRPYASDWTIYPNHHWGK